MKTQTRLPLPNGFRPQDFLCFHARDKQAVAERVTDNTLEKAVVLQGHPALLTLSFEAQAVIYSLAFDDAQPSMTAQDMLSVVQHMLGFTQPITGFEQAFSEHPMLGEIIAKQAGLRVPVSVSPFEAVTWAILGQQVSLNAAISLRRKFIQLANIQHSSGFYCYPGPLQVSQLSLEALRQAGISQSKANTLVKVGELVVAGQLPMNDWLQQQAPATDIAAALASVKGIGPWTISYTLLRGYGWLDGSLHGDAAVRRALKKLMAVDQVSEKEAEQWLQAFSPWRALLAAHLWAWQSHSIDQT